MVHLKIVQAMNSNDRATPSFVRLLIINNCKMRSYLKNICILQRFMLHIAKNVRRIMQEYDRKMGENQRSTSGMIHA
jgi:hypothetical protein